MAYQSMMLSKYQQSDHYWAAAGRAAVSVMAVNATIYLVARLLGVFPALALLPGPAGELSLGLVVISSLLLPVGGFAVFRAMDRHARGSYLVFRAAVKIAVAASLLFPLTIEAWTAPQILATQIMHVVAGVITLRGVDAWLRLAEAGGQGYRLASAPR